VASTRGGIRTNEPSVGSVGGMTRRDALVLRAAAAWTVWVWGTRIWNIWGDEARSFGFKAVHTGLAAVSVVFAVAIWRVAGRTRVRAGR
jgi:hypothetical protein